MWKEAKVVMLPIDNIEAGKILAGDLYLNNEEKLNLLYHIIGESFRFQHLYFTSDEEIKEGIDQFAIGIDGYKPKLIQHPLNNGVNKKIIASTDPMLTKGWIRDNDPLKLNPARIDITTMRGLPQPSKEWIEYFVAEYNKGNVITSVEVELDTDWMDTNGNNAFGYPFPVRVNPENTINCLIHSKDSYTREEVEVLIRGAVLDSKHIYQQSILIDNYIKEKLDLI